MLICVNMYLCVSVTVRERVCLSVCVSVREPVCLFVCVSVRARVCACMCVYLCDCVKEAISFCKLFYPFHFCFFLKFF